MASAMTVSEAPQLSKARFLMLGLFVLLSMSNAFQWIEYAIITDVICDFYGISLFAVSWTSMIYMALYIPLIVPANWLLEMKGLRVAVLLGAAGTCLGSWVKCLSTYPGGFWVTMVGQSIVAASQLFILGIPAELAGVWFGADEVSRATGVGVFGNQLGIALGFVLPPILVHNSEDKDAVASALGVLFYGVAGVTSCLLLLMLFLFREKPPHPPSRARAALQESNCRPSYWVSIVRLLTNVHYMLLLVTYGINVGVFYAISTYLNQMVLSYYPDASESAGWMGLTIVISGMLGSVVCGFLLDKTHKFKETTLGVYILSLCGMVAFTLALQYGNMGSLFVVSALLGFFMTGYLPLGFEFAAELTYPEAEATSSGLLNASAQVFGIAFTMATGFVLEQFSDKESNIALSVSLLIGSVITSFIKSDLRRLKASQLPTADACEKLAPR